MVLFSALCWHIREGHRYSSKNGWHLGVLKVSKALYHAITFQMASHAEQRLKMGQRLWNTENELHGDATLRGPYFLVVISVIKYLTSNLREE